MIQAFKILTIDPSRKALLTGGLIVLLLLAMAFAYALRSRIRKVWNGWFPLAVSTEVIKDDGDFHNVVFLHHSVGDALIRQGGVRAGLTAKSYEFWDHGYNRDGLTRPDGTRTRTMYEVPDLKPTRGGGGNTDPEGLALLFSQPLHSPPDNALGRLLQHSVILFKSCFPNSAIRDDAMLERHKIIYLGIRETVKRHPKRIFILLTTPPLHPRSTAPDQPRRAQALNAWLKSDAYLNACPNLFVFDLFSLLADPTTGTLRTEYQLDPASDDSHPNAQANRAVGPILVAFVDDSVRTYRSRRNANRQAED